MPIYKRTVVDNGGLSPVTPEDNRVLIRVSVDGSLLEKTEYTLLSSKLDFIFIFEKNETLLEAERPIMDNKILKRSYIESGVL